MLFFTESVDVLRCFKSGETLKQRSKINNAHLMLGLRQIENRLTEIVNKSPKYEMRQQANKMKITLQRKFINRRKSGTKIDLEVYVRLEKLLCEVEDCVNSFHLDQTLLSATQQQSNASTYDQHQIQPNGSHQEW